MKALKILEAPPITSVFKEEQKRNISFDTQILVQNKTCRIPGKSF